MNFDDCQLYDMREAALGLRVSKRHLERLIASGEFPKPLKIGSRSLVPLTDVTEYIEKLIRRRDNRSARA